MASFVKVLDDAAATSAAQTWDGGPGILAVKATWGGGSVKIQWLGPDANTYIDTPASSTLSADGSIAFNLPPCTYKIVVATATGVHAAVHSYRTVGPL